ncbi:MAG: aminoacetone oxidase family FAD-binding enzyme [Gemmatimonadales bacterium]|nr:MAG: aminoacetone oxidase family FAD-binding enzyme [Gemmatimonadales bacterium]
MAAIFAGRENPEGGVVLVERSPDGGRKILISGGGRCNVLPSELDPRHYVTRSSPNTLRKLLLSWPLAEQRAFFEEDLGIPLALEAESGKLFPRSNRARDVRDALVQAAREAGVRVLFERSVEGIEPPGSTASWRVHLVPHGKGGKGAKGASSGGGSRGAGPGAGPGAAGRGAETLAASAVILASGGLSVPATGSDGTGLRIVEALGHTLHPVYPALTPLLTDPAVHAELAGVSLEVEIGARGVRGRAGEGRPRVDGGFLFTHRGYSGPSVLNMSHFAVQARAEARPQPLEVAWTGEDAGTWEARLIDASSGSVGPLLRRYLPQRLVDRLLAEVGVPSDRALARLRRDERDRLVEALSAYPLPWTGDEGYRKAEVTGGGVDLAEVDPRTMESRIHPGLYLCGEILDAFGPIGGYNFAWAWATGRMAGRAAAAAAGSVEARVLPDSTRPDPVD